MNLWDYLTKHRLTVTDFGKRLKCSRAHLSKILHGKLRPSQKLAEKIEEVTNGEVEAKHLLQETADYKVEKSGKMDLWEYLRREKLSITDFSKILNYSRVHLSKIIHGKQRPSKKLAIAIEKATKEKIRAEDLLNFEISKK